MSYICKALNKDNLYFMKKWLEYVPEYWHVEDILKKKASDLSDIELKRLIDIKEEKEIANVLTYFYDKLHDTIDFVKMYFEKRDRLDAVIDNFNFETIALNKLNDDELQEINSIIKDYDDTNKQHIRQKINTLNNTFMQEYANYLLTD